jgi:predicted  nucleic acid-binding Zn-ribbon protein
MSAKLNAEQVRQLKAAMEEKEAQAQSYKAELDKLKQEMDQARADRERLQQEADATKDAKERLQREADAAKDEKERLQREADAAKDEKERLQREADATKDEKERLQREADASKDARERLQREADAAKDARERLQREADASKDAKERLQREADAAKDETERLRREAAAAAKDENEKRQHESKDMQMKRTGTTPASTDQAHDSTASTSTSASVSTNATTGVPIDPLSSINNSGRARYGLALPRFEPGKDVESFVAQFEHYCDIQRVPAEDLAGLLISAIKEPMFTVIKRELRTEEKRNYEFVKQHLLKRFDVGGDEDQRRLALRKAKRNPGQEFPAFYTELLGLAARAYPGEHSPELAAEVDKAIRESFIEGCEDKQMRLYLLDRGPKTSRDALALAISRVSALSYNESIKAWRPLVKMRQKRLW